MLRNWRDTIACMRHLYTCYRSERGTYMISIAHHATGPTSANLGGRHAEQNHTPPRRPGHRAVEFSCQPPVSRVGHHDTLDTVPIYHAPIINIGETAELWVYRTTALQPSRVFGFGAQIHVSFDMRFFTSACGQCQSRWVRSRSHHSSPGMPPFLLQQECKLSAGRCRRAEA
jgi:hypothetical protein